MIKKWFNICLAKWSGSGTVHSIQLHKLFMNVLWWRKHTHPWISGISKPWWWTKCWIVMPYLHMADQQDGFNSLNISEVPVQHFFIYLYLWQSTFLNSTHQSLNLILWLIPLQIQYLGVHWMEGCVLTLCYTIYVHCTDTLNQLNVLYMLYRSVHPTVSKLWASNYIVGQSSEHSQSCVT